jgi:hypothetical protein
VLAEAIVLFACGMNHGCDETTSQYLREHPEVKLQLDQDARVITNTIGPTTVNTIGPIIFFFAGGTSNIMLHENLYLQTNKNRGMIMLKKEFK